MLWHAHIQPAGSQLPTVRHRRTVRTETDRRVNCRGDVNDTRSVLAGTEGCCCQRMQQQGDTAPALAHDWEQRAFKYIANTRRVVIVFYVREVQGLRLINILRTACLLLRAFNPAGWLCLRQAWVGVCKVNGVSAAAFDYYMMFNKKEGYFYWNCYSSYSCAPLWSFTFVILVG